MNSIILPDNVSYIINVLRAAGYEAYAVGGCVRDSIMGSTPDDWDITTSALPEQVKELFPKTVDTGIKHGTVTVILHGTGYEVTTYRIDGEYLDGRHPESVSFTASLEEDLKRRDFTINAFVFNDRDGVIDLFDGLSDLKNGIIRCVGEPRARFREDALRILRALRFAARFSFKIAPETLKAAREIGPNLRKVSAERIRTELDKLLISDNPDYILLLHELELDNIVLPEMSTITAEQMETLKKSLRESRSDRCIRWALLCHYLGEGKSSHITSDILLRLKFDNRTIETVTLFVRHALRPLPDSRYTARLLIHDIGWDNLEAYLAFRHAMFPASDTVQLLQLCEDIKNRKECTCIKELAINGRILIDAGFEPGTGIGIILGRLLTETIKDPTINNTATLLQLAEQIN